MLKPIFVATLLYFSFYGGVKAQDENDYIEKGLSDEGLNNNENEVEPSAVDQIAPPPEPLNEDHSSESQQLDYGAAGSSGSSYGFSGGISLDESDEPLPDRPETADNPEDNNEISKKEIEMLNHYETTPVLRSSKSHLRMANETAASGKVFGAYKIHVGAQKPSFSKSDEYELVYGDSSYQPQVGVDYYFFDWYLTMGLTMRMGYYRDRGYAVQAEGDDFEKDKNSKVELTVLPIQIGGVVQATPFKQKWIVLTGWSGFEYDYFEEVRLTESSEGEASDNEGEDSKPYVISGKRYAVFTGAGVSFRLNSLDPKAANSMHSIGLNGIYLTPYVEVVTGLGGEKFNFARNTLGLSFSFETI